MKKNLFKAFLLMMALVFVLSACADTATPTTTTAPPSDTTTTDSTDTTDTTDTADTTDTTDEPATTPQEVVTFTMFNNATLNYIKDPWESPVAAKVTELTGVKLEMEWVVGTDYRQRAAMLIAGGDLPDFVNPGEAVGEFYAADSFIDLDDYVANSTNIKNKYRELELSLARNNQFGTIKGLGTGRPGNPAARPVAGYYLSVDLLKKANYPSPKYLDEYYDLLVNYVAENPEINGAKTIGYTLATAGTRASTIQYGGARFLNGHPNDGVTAVNWDTLEGKVIMNQDWYYDYCKFLWQVNQAGIMDPELFLQTDDQYKSKIASGVVAGYYDQRYAIEDSFNALIQAGNTDAVGIAFPIVFRGVETERYNGPMSFSTQAIICISNKCKDPDRAFKFLDDFMSDEVQKLVKWGIEGEDWIYVDGVMERTEEEWIKRQNDVEYDKSRGIGQFTFLNTLDGTKEPNYSLFSDGNFSDPAQSESFKPFLYRDFEIELMANYGWATMQDVFYPQYQPRHDAGWLIRNNMPIEDISNGRQATEDALTETIQALPKIVLAKDEATFESEYTKFQDKLATMNLDAYVETATQMLRDSYPIYHNGEAFVAP